MAESGGRKRGEKGSEKGGEGGGMLVSEKCNAEACS